MCVEGSTARPRRERRAGVSRPINSVDKLLRNGRYREERAGPVSGATRGPVSTVQQHYKSNLRDIFFNLFEVLEIQHKTLGHGEFAGMDEETARSTLEAYEEFCQKELSPSWAVADR